MFSGSEVKAFGLPDLVSDSPSPCCNKEDSSRFNITPEKSLTGFVSQVLSKSISPKFSKRRGLVSFETGRFARIFLLSKESQSKPNARKESGTKKATIKRKEASVRKHITHSNIFRYEGCEYPINSKPTGVYTGMLGKAVTQLNKAWKLWGRVLIVRIDLHQAKYTEDSKQVSWFFKYMIRKLKAHYGLNQVGYFWVREQERAKSQHYHTWLFLDAGRVKHSAEVLKMAKSLWVEQRHIPITKNPFKLIDSEDKIKEAVYWLSYGCKGRGKGYRPPQNKDYSTSRLKVIKKD